jgi:hypothetical protein
MYVRAQSSRDCFDPLGTRAHAYNAGGDAGGGLAYNNSSGFSSTMDVDLSPRAIVAQVPAPFARTFASVSPTFVVKMRERREHLQDMQQHGVCSVAGALYAQTTHSCRRSSHPVDLFQTWHPRCKHPRPPTACADLTLTTNL